ncbi:MAG: 4-hydroxy-3-methylbut-2-enyl diphosphate reductase [Candidatus Xenobia bacterium]
MKVLLASPRGFCAGVARAVDIVHLALEAYGPPVYVRHEIVHNRHVVEDLQQHGAVFVNETSDVPQDGVVIFSAHGVAPGVWQDARKRGLRIIDATCPLVTKVHLEAIKYARRGYTVVLIGHAGHPEVEGTMGEAPEATRLVQSIADVQRLEVADAERVVVLTQTTLSVDETDGILAALREKYPRLALPPKDDICYATTNRQVAVKELATCCQLVLVIGASYSSNSRRLVEVAESCGTPARLISCATDIEIEWLKGVQQVGVTAGASAPERLVDEVLSWLQAHGAVSVEERVIVPESMHFALPRQLVREARDRGRGLAIVDRHSIHAV